METEFYHSKNIRYGDCLVRLMDGEHQIYCHEYDKWHTITSSIVIHFIDTRRVLNQEQTKKGVVYFLFEKL